jgi:hypothetical protein
MTIKTMWIGIAITFGITVGSGVLQGRLSNRWGPSHALQQAGANIEVIPQKFAAWEMKKAETMGEAALNQLQPTGYIQRLYVNRDSGASVNVMVIVGMSGPIAVHTPEICYGTQNNQLLGPRQATRVPCATGGEETVWKTTFRMKGIDAQVQNVYYAWSIGDHWVAADNPRFAYATKPLLYKIQLTSVVPSGLNDQATDPGLQFLTDFLPVLQEHLRNSSSL